MTKQEIAAQKAEADKLAAEQKIAEDKLAADKLAEENAKKTVEPTNAKIEELKAKKIELQRLSMTLEPGTKARDENSIAEWQIGQDIIKEIAEIRKQEADAKKQELRATKLQLVAALFTHYTINADLTPEQLDEVKNAREVIENIVLGTVKTTTTTDKKTGEGNGSKGQTTAAIRAYARPFYEGATRETVGEIGKNVRKDLIGQGFNDGTMNAAVRALEVELGLKD